jgi:fructose-1,6-bisphosphatase I
MLVLTFGCGADGFTLDSNTSTFYLTHPQMRIPADTQEFAINMSNYRHWETPMQRYIDECLQGVTGIRKKDFNMRWVGYMVADDHRKLMRGGVFMYLANKKIQSQGGKLRLLYEANPMSYIVEQAGGKAANGYQHILDLMPASNHQRVPVILGSSNEVERILEYHQANT